MDTELKSLGHVQSTLTDMALRFGPKVVATVLILLARLMVGGWLGRATDGALRRFALEPPVRLLIVRVVRVLVLGLFAIVALQNLGVELLPLIAGLGVAGAGLALATQGVLSNVVAGLTIIFTKPYKVGEYIAVVGVEGEVEAITLFSTTLRHADHSRIVVPNGKVVGEILQNFGSIRQCEIHVGIAYESDLSAALGIIRDLVQANDRVLQDPKPVIQVLKLADSAILIAVKPWVAVSNFAPIIGEINLSLVEELRKREISIPYPHREVR